MELYFVDYYADIDITQIDTLVVDSSDSPDTDCPVCHLSFFEVTTYWIADSPSAYTGPAIHAHCWTPPTSTSLITTSEVAARNELFESLA